MKTETQPPKPPLIPSPTMEGWLYQQKIRCGKPNCKCATRQHHHTAYYLFFKRDGKLRRRHIRKRDVEAFRQAVRIRDERKRAERELTKQSLTHWSKLRETLRTNIQELPKDGTDTYE